MEIYEPYRKCPVCDGRNAKVLHEVAFVLFEGHPMKNGYTLVQCDACLFVYADTTVTQAELDYYYKELSKYEDKTIGTGGGYTPADKDRLSKAARFISDNVDSKDISIVDIGCANGGLLKELKELGFTKLVGVDPSEACVEITRLEVGCVTHQYSVLNIDESIGKFDLIILSHVLEHILDLASIMQKLNSLLKPDGMIYAECPNANNYYKIIHAPFQELNTEHINHFTDVAFQNLFGLNSFKKINTGNRVLKIASGQDYHAVYGLFKKVVRLDYTCEPDEEVLGNIESYLAKSDEIFKAIEHEISLIPDTHPIALFGIGQFAFKLLASPIVKKKRVTKLFDNNSLNIGKKIKGNVVTAGKNVREEYLRENFSIIITSIIHEDGIKEQITKSFLNDDKNPEIIGFKNILKLADVY